MATISRVSRKDGYAYLARIDLKGIEPFSKTFKLRKHAKAWADRMERNIEEARAYGNAEARTMTLQKLIDEHIEAQPNPEYGMTVNLGWWAREYGDIRLAEITRPLVRQALKRLTEGHAHRGNGKGKRTATSRPRSPATIKRYKSALSSAFEYGREHYELPENPCRGIKLRGTDNARVRFLSDDERKALLEACQASKWDRLYLLVLMAITTGARQGELLRLSWADLDLASRRAYVRRSKNGEPRVLPLTGEVVTILKALPRPIDSTILIFPAHHIRKTDNGRQLVVSDPHKPFEFRPYWNKAMKAAKLDNFRFHDLRHTCASYLAQNGATLLQIADVLGHRQLEVTKRYSHLCVNHKQDLVDRVLGGVK